MPATIRCQRSSRPTPASLELGSGGAFSGRFTVPAASPEGENRVWVYCVSEGGEPMAGPIVGVFVVDNSLHLRVHQSSPWSLPDLSLL